MDAVNVQLVRLRRHYEHAMDICDGASLLDLSHSLRIWAEMREHLATAYPAFDSTKRFRSASVQRKVLRAATGNPFVFVYLGGPTLTRANLDGPMYAWPNPPTDFYAAGSARQTVAGLELGYFAYTECAIEQPIMHALKNGDVASLNYAQWLGAEAAKVCRRDESGALKISSVPRLAIIKRVANTMGGSHPVDGGEDAGLTNAYDPFVQGLMAYKAGGLPLPYFILMKCAQDILDIVPDLMTKKV